MKEDQICLSEPHNYGNTIETRYYGSTVGKLFNFAKKDKKDSQKR